MCGERMAQLEEDWEQTTSITVDVEQPLHLTSHHACCMLDFRLTSTKSPLAFM